MCMCVCECVWAGLGPGQGVRVMGGLRPVKRELGGYAGVLLPRSHRHSEIPWTLAAGVSSSFEIGMMNIFLLEEFFL